MFNIPPITKNLIIINVIMYLAKVVASQYGIDLDNILGLHFVLASEFQIYQLFTYMFMHSGLSHLFFNMFALWMFGRTMELVWGRNRYLTFYFVCGVGAGLMQELWQFGTYLIDGLGSYEMVNLGGSQLIPVAEYLNYWTTIGASGACYGILLGFGMTFPEERILLLIPPIPIKAKYFVVGYAVIEMLSAITSTGNIAHFAHLGGMLFGFFLIRYWRRNNRNNRGGFTGWTNYQPKKKGLWDKFKDKFSFDNKTKENNHRYQGRNDDYEYNARKKAHSEEIDRILEKIKKSGYDSLTEEEKKKLFDAGKL